VKVQRKQKWFISASIVLFSGAIFSCAKEYSQTKALAVPLNIKSENTKAVIAGAWLKGEKERRELAPNETLQEWMPGEIKDETKLSKSKDGGVTFELRWMNGKEPAGKILLLWGSSIYEGIASQCEIDQADLHAQYKKMKEVYSSSHSSETKLVREGLQKGTLYCYYLESSFEGYEKTKDGFRDETRPRLMFILLQKKIKVDLRNL
jgi:hypothetical protein